MYITPTAAHSLPPSLWCCLQVDHLVECARALGLGFATQLLAKLSWVDVGCFICEVHGAVKWLLGVHDGSLRNALRFLRRAKPRDLDLLARPRLLNQLHVCANTGYLACPRYFYTSATDLLRELLRSHLLRGDPAARPIIACDGSGGGGTTIVTTTIISDNRGLKPSTPDVGLLAQLPELSELFQGKSTYFIAEFFKMLVGMGTSSLWGNSNPCQWVGKGGMDLHVYVLGIARAVRAKEHLVSSGDNKVSRFASLAATSSFQLLTQVTLLATPRPGDYARGACKSLDFPVPQQPPWSCSSKKVACSGTHQLQASSATRRTRCSTSWSLRSILCTTRCSWWCQLPTHRLTPSTSCQKLRCQKVSCTSLMVSTSCFTAG